MGKQAYIFLFLLLALAFGAGAQSKTSPPPAEASAPAQNSVSKAASKLSISLEEESEEQVAAGYVNLARELFNIGDYKKAEENLKKALALYEKLKDRRQIAAVNRELARVQEAQQKIPEAISSYEEASAVVSDQVMKQLNTNDADRLRNAASPMKQAELIQSNLDLMGTKLVDEKEPSFEKADAYIQMARANEQMDKKDEAIGNYEVALENAPTPASEIRIKQDMAALLATENRHGEAIDLLAQAYDQALAEHNTLDAKASLELLATEYEKVNQPDRSLALYKDFLEKLESLIRSDSLLVDVKLFEATEEKIQQLEKERELKDALIHSKNIFSYWLIGFLAVMVALLFLIVKSLQTIKRRNKRIALQSLRREMNPHFIFNSLNSLNQFISENDELQANRYLSSYSGLMRNVMENSNRDFIRLGDELTQLRKYMELEYLRFKEKFSYAVDLDPALDPDAVWVPNMVIQPFLENAVWHGLRYKEGAGLLRLAVTETGGRIVVTVEDNGIGLTQSRAIKTENQKLHRSRGMDNIRERIRLLNELYHSDIIWDVSEKEAPATGVIVTISFPANLKPSAP